MDNKILLTRRDIRGAPSEVYNRLCLTWWFGNNKNKKWCEVIPYCLVTDGEDWIVFTNSNTTEFGFKCFPQRTKRFYRSNKESFNLFVEQAIKKEFFQIISDANFGPEEILIGDTGRAIYAIDKLTICPLYIVILPKKKVKFNPVKKGDWAVVSKDSLIKIGMLEDCSVLAQGIAALFAMSEINVSPGDEKNVTT